MDLGVFGLAYLPHVLWHLGYPDQALAKSREAIELTQELSHPFSLAAALNYASMLAQFRRESHAAYEWADAAVALCKGQGLAYYLAWGTIILGWALVEWNQAKEGIAQMHQGLAALRATGAEVRLPYYLALLAEALEQAHRKGESWHDAELHRLKGELLLAVSAEQSAQAEACFRHALEMTRRQKTKGLELRTAISLSRLWQQQGKQGAVREHLAPIYDWFTEGFDTADFEEAKAFGAGLEE